MERSKRLGKKAKGQLGNFLKGAENSRECVSHSLAGSCFSEARLLQGPEPPAFLFSPGP